MAFVSLLYSTIDADAERGFCVQKRIQLGHVKLTSWLGRIWRGRRVRRGVIHGGRHLVWLSW